MPRPGNVLGLVGTNGIGKSTALKILSGKLKPNLGRYDNPPDWEDVIKYFRGSELQNYFTKLLEDDLTSVVKPQYVDQLPRAVKGPEKSVRALIDKQKQLDNLDEVLDVLELRHIYEREVTKLSGGELQRFAIGLTCVSILPLILTHRRLLTMNPKIGSKQGCVHVRRAFLISRCQAASGCCQDDQVAIQAQ